MYEEQKSGQYKWLVHDNLKFRIQNVDDEKAIVWGSVSGVDLCFTLLFYEFIEHCSENLRIDIDIDSSWNGWRGYVVKNSEADVLVGEMINFALEWDIEPNENADRISDEKWYSE